MIVAFLVVLRGVHLALKLGATIVSISFAIRLLIGARDAELVLEPGIIRWGRVGIRDNEGIVALASVTALWFHRREDGTGSIEVEFQSGKRTFVADHFIEQPGVGDSLVAKLRTQMPELIVTID
jgi:hypothetical protein